MKFAYLVLVHKNPLQLCRLINALDNEDSIFIVHVDAKIPIWPFIQQINSNCKGRVFFCNERKSIIWGLYSMIEATMALINYFFKLDFNADFIHLLSGQDYPIRSNDAMNKYLQENKSKNFISYFTLPDKRWGNSLDRVNYLWGVNSEESYSFSDLDYRTANVKDIALPQDIQLYGGSQWWTLQYKCVEYLHNQFLNKHNLFEFFRFSFIPDEMLFQTILMKSPFKNSIVNNNLRYIKWVDGKMHPEIIVCDNINELSANNDALFARKFDADNSVLEEVDEKCRFIEQRKQSSIMNSCVISAVGKNSLHKEWTKGALKKFDIHLIVYDDSFELYKNDGDFVIEAQGYKLKLVYDYLIKNPQLLDMYDYLFIPDDDILMDANNISKLFFMMKEYNLSIAQPALYDDSYFTFKHTLHYSGLSIRYTNFVEMMLPCFSRDALKEVLFTFNENESGWGADYHWGNLVNSENYKMAILDEVKAIHTRPIQSGREKNRNELAEYLNKYNLNNDIIEYF